MRLLFRYENGALQTEAHDKAFRLAMEPHNLLRLLEQAPQGAVDEEKRTRIAQSLRAMEEETFSLERIYNERFGRYEADEFSGYRKLDLERLLNGIIYFCKGGVLKTKLNKLSVLRRLQTFQRVCGIHNGRSLCTAPFRPRARPLRTLFRHLDS